MKRNFDLGLLILRGGISALMLTHGYGKFMSLLEGNLAFGGNPIGIGETLSSILLVLAEFVCPILIIIGFKTRLASIPPVIAMAVAALIVHANDPIGTKEGALLYLIGFLAIGLMGAGKISMDKK